MKVPTANVIIAFNRQTMDRLFSEGATYTSLIQGITESGEDDALLFNAESNPNFISFEHSMNYGSGLKMKLEFIDPKGVFEERYLSTNLVDNITGYDYKKTQPSTDVFSDKINKGMKKSQEGYDDAYFTEFSEQIEKKYSTREIYVAYGSGDNLALWSGPHRTVLNSADIQVKGARKISITLVPTPQSLVLSQRRGAFNEQVNLNLKGMTARWKGNSKKIKFDNLLNNTNGSQVAYDPLDHLPSLDSSIQDIVDKERTKTEITFKNKGLDSLASNLGEFDIHSLVVDTLRSYITKATGNQNVVLLLPDINLICRKIIDEVSSNSRVSWWGAKPPRNEGLNIAAADPGNQDSTALDPEEVLSLSEQISPDSPLQLLLPPPSEEENFNNALSKVYEAQTSNAPRPQPAVGNFAYDSIYNTNFLGQSQNLFKVGEKEYFIKNLLSKFGLLLKSVVKEAIESSSNKNAFPQENVNSFLTYSQGKTATQRFEDKYVDRDFYSVLEKASNSGIPDHMKVVKDVIDSINKNAMGEYNIKLDYITETDTKILDFWSQNEDINCSMFPLFGGYNKLDTTKETIIVGDIALIKEYLYAKINLEDVDSDIQKIKDNASKESLVIPQVSPGVDGLPPTQIDNTIPTYDPQVIATADISILKRIPLHPIDKALLVNSDYNKKMKKIVFPNFFEDPQNLVGSFGDITDLPDEFGFDEFSQTEKDYIKKQPVSIFRFNTENPNVLDLDFKFGGVYFGALNFGYKKMVKNISSACATGILPIGTGSFPIRTRGDAVAFLRTNNYSLGQGPEERQEVIDSLANRISPELAESLRSSPEEGSDALAALLRSKEGNDDFKGFIEIDQLLPGNPMAAMNTLVDDMYRQALNLTITTLPAFHLSRTVDLSMECILFAQDADILQTQDPPRTSMNSFFSGIYKIIGYKHKISSKGVNSEFKLTKNTIDYNSKEGNIENE
jgi:hypothetical protein